MVEAHHNELLNQLLVNISRSLLQYVGECWPWTGYEDTEERNVVSAAVYRQREDVQKIANLLLDRNWHTDFGSYPTDYTDLHFVDLDFLLPQILDGERALSADLERAIGRASSDPEAVALLREVLATQATIVNDLTRLVAPRPTA